jgi:hypothetical protein
MSHLKLLPVYAALLLAAACSQPGVKATEPAATVTQASQPATAQSEPIAEDGATAEANLPKQPLTPDILFKFLVAEVAGQRGEIGIAQAAYLDLARQPHDPRIARRAAEVSMFARDQAGAQINDVTITPERITADLDIIQRGGYRNVVVKVVTSGQVASGYRLTNISVFPPAVTVFSTNPQAVERLPGFVETIPINLEGVKEDLEINATLNLPAGISLVDEQSVTVQVGIAAIEGSVTLSNMRVEAS